MVKLFIWTNHLDFFVPEEKKRQGYSFSCLFHVYCCIDICLIPLSPSSLNRHQTNSNSPLKHQPNLRHSYIDITMGSTRTYWCFLLYSTLSRSYKRLCARLSAAFGILFMYLVWQKDSKISSNSVLRQQHYYERRFFCTKFSSNRTLVWTSSLVQMCLP